MIKVLFSSAIFLSFVFASMTALAKPGPVKDRALFPERPLKWNDFQAKINEQANDDYINGLSYVISGSLALVGGQMAQSVTNDPLEKGVYTLFQTIGIASIGYGAYVWQIGDDSRLIYNTAMRSGLSDSEKERLIQSYRFEKERLRKKERMIRAITHGLIAALNIYNATQQTNEPVRNGLYFIGGANLLASISFTF